MEWTASLGSHDLFHALWCEKIITGAVHRPNDVNSGENARKKMLTLAVTHLELVQIVL